MFWSVLLSYSISNQINVQHKCFQKDIIKISSWRDIVDLSQYVHIYLRLYINLRHSLINLSIYLSIYLSICLSIYLFKLIFIDLTLHIYILHFYNLSIDRSISNCSYLSDKKQRKVTRMCMRVCAWVCVCVSEWEWEREREIKKVPLVYYSLECLSPYHLSSYPTRRRKTRI